MANLMKLSAYYSKGNYMKNLVFKIIWHITEKRAQYISANPKRARRYLEKRGVDVDKAVEEGVKFVRELQKKNEE